MSLPRWRMRMYEDLLCRTLRVSGALAVLLCTLPIAAQEAEPTEPSEPVSEPAPQPNEPTPSEPQGSPPEAPVNAPAAPADSVDESEIAAAIAADHPPTSHAETTAETTSARPMSSASNAMNPDISIIGDFAVAAFSEDENHQTGGHDPTENGFNLQQLELSFGASVDPYLRFDGNIVFSLFGVEVEEAYGTTLDLGGRFQARFGQFLTRFGRINSTHPHAWHFVDQPFAIGRIFGGEGNRGLGAELSYLTPLPWYVELVASATRADGAATARSFFGSNDLGVDGPLDVLYVAALKQFFALSNDWSLFWGLSGAFGPNSSGRQNRTEVYGTDLYIKYRPISRDGWTAISLETEWLHRRRQIPEDVLADVNGYAQLVYQFDRRWATAARYEYGTPSYDSGGDVATDPLDPEWRESRTRLSLNLTHYPTEFSRFRLQGSRDAGFDETAVWAAFLAAEVVIGAHGAHKF